MEENLISKKELLQKYGMSYGALYRWKRKGLIPDDWFIKKSTVTGQETFFPRDLICERVELIIEKKEDIPLDTLAENITGHEKVNRTITLVTAFGSKTYRMSDVSSVLIDGGDGVKIEITEKIIDLFGTEENNK